MIIAKFGGTSVGSAERFRAVFEIVNKTLEKDRSVIVVLSAMSAITNGLVDAANKAVAGNFEEALLQVSSMRLKHEVTAKALFPTQTRFRAVMNEIELTFCQLEILLKGISYVGELSPRSLDAVSGFGEMLSSRLFAEFASDFKMNCVWFDARKVITTDNDFGKASPLWDVIANKASAEIKPLLAAGKVVITQGFIGATDKGVPTTLGRGGSDFSASILGVTLNASEIQIWTDVSGMMTADPRTVAEATVIPEVSFSEASELAYFGAKVLHPYTIIPAVEKNIPVKILNTLHPDHAGTLIKRDAQKTGTVCGIAAKRGLVAILIHSPTMFQSHGFLARVFEVFDRHKVSIDLIATSEVYVSLTIERTAALPDIIKDLSPHAEITCLEDVASVTVVGREFRQKKGIGCCIFHSLQDINVLMVSGGASDITVSVVVAEADVDRAVQALHREFFNSNSGSENSGGKIHELEAVLS